MMYTCPDKELLSAYIDSEVPEVWAKQMSEHVQSCPKCSELLGKMRQLSILTRSQIIKDTFTAQELEDSYCRLQTKLKFKQHTAGPHNSFSLDIIPRFLPSVAAAIVFAMLIPFTMFKKTENYQHTGAFIPQATVKTDLINNVGIVVHGNVAHSAVAAQFGNTAGNSVSPLEITVADNMDYFHPTFEKNDPHLSIRIPQLTDLLITPIVNTAGTDN